MSTKGALRATTGSLLLLAGLVLALSGADRSPRIQAGTQQGPPESRAAVPEPESRDEPPARRAAAAGPRKIPSAQALRAARRFAASREGTISFSVVNSEGRLRGRDVERRYPSASVVKAMLLAAELRRLTLARRPLDQETDALLRSMITVSDNAAADSIYARVGDPGLLEVAERAGMERFAVAGYWGNAQVSAGDLARLFANLEKSMRGPHLEYGLGLLGSIAPEQSWGVGEVVSERFAVRFKGGWLPERALVHQAAEIREIDGSRELSLAVLTDAQPSFEYGIASVGGVAQRLLRRGRHDR